MTEVLWDLLPGYMLILAGAAMMALPGQPAWSRAIAGAMVVGFPVGVGLSALIIWGLGL